MRFFFYQNQGDVWDWRTPDARGIGNSETCQCELARILAARGHQVTSFAPCKPSVHRKVRWLPAKQAAKRLNEPGVWVVSRSPHFLDSLSPMTGRRVWFVSQDVEYGDALTEERLKRIDRLLALCPTHAEYLAHRYPSVKERIVTSSNGVRVDLMERLEAKPVERNPYRIIYTSSPDRGLDPLLKIFARAREFEPRLELVVAYGFENLERAGLKNFVAGLKSKMDQPGVTHVGRLPQPALYDLIRSAGIWCYPTDFQETGCVSHLEAMCLGAVPVFSPLWAQEHNGGHGIAIPGSADDPLTRARFVRAILRLAWFPQLQEQIRAEMMPAARRQFSWGRVADHYEAMAYEPKARAA